MYTIIPRRKYCKLQKIEVLVKNERRLAWIEACIRYVGRFGVNEKKALIHRFNASPSSISRDQVDFLAAWELRFGTGIITEEKGKLKLSNGALIPEGKLFDLPDLDDWLSASLPRSFHTISGFGRAKPNPDVLRHVILAIEDRRPLLIEYLSRSSGEEAKRKRISPHSLVEVVGRYHMRGYDHERGRFADFVLSRIQSCSFETANPGMYTDEVLDHDWLTTEPIEIEAVETASLAATRVDFGLDTFGRKTVRVKKALSPYLIDDFAEGFSKPVTIKRAQ